MCGLARCGTRASWQHARQIGAGKCGSRPAPAADGAARGARGGAAAKAAAPSAEDTAARARFGNAKSISSAQFQYDAAAGNDYESQARAGAAARPWQQRVTGTLFCLCSKG